MAKATAILAGIAFFIGYMIVWSAIIFALAMVVVYFVTNPWFWAFFAIMTVLATAAIALEGR